jgi:acyl-coenzyme A synthetase/AMP-(fatty) acid ligase/acyl carrier protein
VEQIYATTHADKVYNLYGPTETTTYSTYTLVRRGCPVTIGQPIANTQCYILDASRHPVPIGVKGELYLAGGGLARGYYGRPELTDERFVPNPFSEARAGRMYRTGDLCRRLPDGNIQYLGRIDHQIKLRGFRIELGEIESVLRSHSGVREAVVVAREDEPGEKRLVAYVVLAGEPACTTAELRDYLKQKLPDYMVPAAWVVLPALPLTPNGKLDRKGLPAPEAEAYSHRGYEAPQGETETLLAALWGEVLKLDRVGRRDNFFELGGHSLMATQLVSRIRTELGIDVPLRSLFESPTVAQFAEYVQAVHWISPEASVSMLAPGAHSDEGEV